jgi:hypothetical protein
VFCGKSGGDFVSFSSSMSVVFAVKWLSFLEERIGNGFCSGGGGGCRNCLYYFWTEGKENDCGVLRRRRFVD